jgi:hypothetical protein
MQLELHIAVTVRTNIYNVYMLASELIDKLNAFRHICDKWSKMQQNELTKPTAFYYSCNFT